MKPNDGVPRLTVIFATYNGGEILRNTLEGYCQQDQPVAEWRLIVADNNSSDETPNILSDFTERLPLSVVRVTKQGKNVALNAILEEIIPHEGLIVITDDDAVPDKTFLSSWENVGARYPEYSLFGGVVKPLFPNQVPEWLRQFKDNFEVLYAVNDRPEGSIEARFIFGPNMAVRGSIFNDGIRFDETIGPNSNDARYPMGSETEFCVRAERELNLKSLFVRSPTVLHQIRPHHVSREFIAGRAVRHGRGFAMQMLMADAEKAPANWKLDVKIAIAKIGAIAGIHRAFWQYNWLNGFREALRSAGN